MKVYAVAGMVSCVVAFPHYARYIHDSIPAHKPRSCYKGTLSPKHFTWKAPGEGDLRAPCPVMNTLANHGFVPHDGRHITREPFVQACGEALNISPEFANGIFTNGIPSNPMPNATFFDLDMLHDTHGFIEHDGSLSRKDIFFDPSNRFDPETFDNLMSYFGDSETIDIPSLANARARQALDMSLVNPEFEITQESIPVIVGENAMLLSIFGNPPENPVARRDWFEFFFRNEQFPVALGWSPPSAAIGPSVGIVVEAIIAQSPPDVPLTFGPKGI